MQNTLKGRLRVRCTAPHHRPGLGSWQVVLAESSALVAELWPNLLWPDRTLRHSVRPNAAKLRGLKHLQRGEIPTISHPLRLVETAGIEPASAIAQKVASTSVAGALISPSTHRAGGVVEGQLRKLSSDRPERTSPSEPAG